MPAPLGAARAAPPPDLQQPEKQSSCTVRPAGPDDLPRIAELHGAHLPHGLFPRLGPRFLRRWHRTFLDSPHGIALVTDDDGEVSGFLVGTSRQRAYVTGVLRRQRKQLAATGLLCLALRPRVAFSFLRTRAGKYVRRIARPTPAVAAGDGTLDLAVITALVVDPALRGCGQGAALVERFAELAGAAGAERAELVTLEGPEGATQFYASLGWEEVRTKQNKDGDAVALMRARLGGAAESAVQEELDQ